MLWWLCRKSGFWDPDLLKEAGLEQACMAFVLFSSVVCLCDTAERIKICVNSVFACRSAVILCRVWVGCWLSALDLNILSTRSSAWCGLPPLPRIYVLQEQCCWPRKGSALFRRKCNLKKLKKPSYASALTFNSAKSWVSEFWADNLIQFVLSCSVEFK